MIPWLPPDEKAMIDRHKKSLADCIDRHVRERILPDLREMNDEDDIVWRTWDDRWLQALGWIYYGYTLWLGPRMKPVAYEELTTKRVLKEYDEWAAAGWPDDFTTTNTTKDNT